MLTFVEHFFVLLSASLLMFTYWPVWIVLVVGAGIITAQRGGWTHLWRSAWWAVGFVVGFLWILVFGTTFWGQVGGGTALDFVAIALLILNGTAAFVFIYTDAEYRLTRLCALFPPQLLTVTACILVLFAVSSDFGGS